ncbi:MAG: hypothetical protein ACP5MD_16910 [Verrucomicrobiia bacterium]
MTALCDCAIRLHDNLWAGGIDQVVVPVLRDTVGELACDEQSFDIPVRVPAEHNPSDDGLIERIEVLCGEDGTLVQVAEPGPARSAGFRLCPVSMDLPTGFEPPKGGTTNRRGS